MTVFSAVSLLEFPAVLLCLHRNAHLFYPSLMLSLFLDKHVGLRCSSLVWVKTNWIRFRLKITPLLIFVELNVSNELQSYKYQEGVDFTFKVGA